MSCPIIIAEHNEPNDKFRLCISIQPITDAAARDPVQAVREAVRDFAATDLGKQAIRRNSGGFNWGDVVNDLPASVCTRHGFVIVDSFVSEIVVDHNERLNVDEDGEVIA